MRLPDDARKFFYETGDIARFSIRFFQEAFRPRYEFREFIHQCYVLGFQSLPIVALTAFIMGFVLTMQLRPQLVHFGVESMIPSMVGIAIVREIGPVIIALIFAGKIGSGISAELGSIKDAGQIDAMEVSGTNTFKFLVVTRILAATLMLPVLIILGDAVSLYGSYLGFNIWNTTTLTLYYTQVFEHMTYNDLVPAFIKSFFFGFAVGIIGCYKGYHSEKGTEGVGHSTNAAIVMSSVLIFIIDLLAVQISDLF